MQLLLTPIEYIFLAWSKAPKERVGHRELSFSLMQSMWLFRPSSR